MTTGWSVAFDRIRARVDRVGTPRVSVLAFSIALGVVGIVALVLAAPKLEAVRGPFSIPWPLFAVAYFGIELKVIDVHFRRETHSFSLSEIPAVAGLFLVEPSGYVLGVVIGAGLAHMWTRQPAAKILFNLSQFLLGSVVSLVLFDLIGAGSGPPTMVDWIAAFVAMVSWSLMGAVTIAVAITLSGGAPQFQRLPQMIEAGALVAIANTSLALLAVEMLWVDPAALWLVIVPIATIFVAYRAYLNERQKHESLELLYESSKIFQHSPELDSAIVAMLEHARMMFRCDWAEIVLVNGDGPEPVRTRVGPKGVTEVMVAAPDRAEMLERLVNDPTPYIFSPPQGATQGGRLFRYTMIAPLPGESHLLGAMIVSDRTDDDEEFHPEELRLLGTIANQAAIALENGQLEQSLTELSRLKEELRHQAFHDSLTGLANRALFVMELDLRLAASGGAKRSVVLFLDLDDFKVVNDTVGHTAGDHLLEAVSAVIRSIIAPDHLAARLGGDEFAILMADDPELGDALAIADRIIDALRTPFRIAGRDFSIGASIGIASMRQDQRGEELLRNADVAMYAAKARGKGQVSVWDPHMHAAIIERHELSADLAGAISREELQVHYQPIVALATGVVVGFEALVRWNHPTRGPVPPDSFIRLAEESGAIVPLGRLVLRKACEDGVRWSKIPGLEQLTMSVNLSPHQVHRAEFIDEARGIVAETGYPASQLILEMTETAMFRDFDATVGRLQALRQDGIRIAIDDFGTGYSSLSYLRRFRVDILKIAREFIEDEDGVDVEDGWAFAHAILMLGKTLGLTVTAEGIETAAQRDRLRELGCDRGQGFLFGRALPAEVVPAAVADIRRDAQRQRARLAADAPSLSNLIEAVA